MSIRLNLHWVWENVKLGNLWGGGNNDAYYVQREGTRLGMPNWGGEGKGQGARSLVSAWSRRPWPWWEKSQEALDLLSYCGWSWGSLVPGHIFMCIIMPLSYFTHRDPQMMWAPSHHPPGPARIFKVPVCHPTGRNSMPLYGGGTRIFPQLP